MSASLFWTTGQAVEEWRVVSIGWPSQASVLAIGPLWGGALADRDRRCSCSRLALSRRLTR